VWPFIPAANPALTLAALSQRLAKTLKSRLWKPTFLPGEEIYDFHSS
jgi:hypothetical protein